MNRNYDEQPNGYLETIQKGLAGVRNFRDGLSLGIGTRAEQIDRLKTELKTADAIVIGAGAGLSTSAGFVYSGERFRYWFSDFAERFGINTKLNLKLYHLWVSFTPWRCFIPVNVALLRLPPFSLATA